MDSEVNVDGGEGAAGPAPEILIEARSMGWSEKERFRGDPNNWVDAEEFVRRGREVLPLIKANNKRLASEVAEAKAEVRNLKSLIDAQTQTVEKIVKNQDTLVQKQVEARLAELRSQKRAAIREGNHDLAADLEEDIDQTREELQAAKSAPPASSPSPSSAPAEQVPPWARQFVEDNSDWLMKDKRRTSLFQGIADDLLESSELRGTELLEEAKRQMEETLSGGKRKPAASKVESGTTNPSGSGSGTSKGFNDLPADAKAACKAQTRLYVGPGKAFKTEKEWQDFFVNSFEG